MALNNKYRIITDDYNGFEVQIKRWWFPFWIQKRHHGSINSWKTVESAKNWIDKGCPPARNVNLKVVWRQ